MRIAVNTRFLLSNKMEGFGWYTYEVVKRIVESHPEHEFIFFFDRAYDQKFIFSDNITPVVLNPQARHPILFKIWFEFSISRALKKYKADIFFSPDGFLSLKSNIKQVNVIHDINFEHNPDDLPKNARKYLQKYFPKFARKAQHILTVSEYSKQDICSTYNIDQDKVTVAWNGASEVFMPISTEQKEELEKKYAQGNPYLLFVGALHPRKNVQRLIQAFEQMKLDDLNNPYKLIIVGEELFSGALGSFTISDELRSHISFTGHLKLKELALLMGGASVFTFVPYFEGFGIPLVEAMRCGTPILSGDKTSLPEVAGEAALYCDPFSIPDITEKLTTICNDPVLRDSLSKKGIERSHLFSWNTSAEKVWKVLQSVSKQ